MRDTIKVHHFAIFQTLKFIIFLSLLIVIPLIIVDLGGKIKNAEYKNRCQKGLEQSKFSVSKEGI
jgi:hypothetical protein